jgi:hypothetical protein
MIRRAGVTTIAVVALMLAHLDALTVIPMTFEELVGDATAVVYVRVAEVRGQMAADRHSIDSILTLEPLRYLKGDMGPSVVMRLPGGRVGNLMQVLPGAPVLQQGDLAIVFLAARGPAIPASVGLGQGIFRVAFDARTRQALVTPPPLKSSDLGRIIRGAADRRTLTLDAFAASVRAAGAAR